MPSLFDQLNPYGQTSRVDQSPPENAYNVSRPLDNRVLGEVPADRAAAFRKKRLDMQGNVIDLDNMPADATVIKNHRSPTPQFDRNTPQVDRDYASKNMQDVARANGTLDETTGYAKREPLKGYNNTTGEYFTMAAGGERVSDARAREWANRIRANDVTAAGIEERKLAAQSARDDALAARTERSSASKLEGDRFTEIARHNKAVEDEAIRNGDVNRSGVTSAEKRAQATFDQAAVTADLARADQMEPQARAAIYAKHGIVLDAAKAGREAEQAKMAALFTGMKDGNYSTAVTGYESRLGGFATPQEGFGNNGDTVKGLGSDQISSHRTIRALRDDLSSEARRLSAAYGTDYAETRRQLVLKITNSLPAKTPRRDSIIQALSELPAAGVQPAATDAAPSSFFLNP